MPSSRAPLLLVAAAFAPSLAWAAPSKVLLYDSNAGNQNARKAIVSLGWTYTASTSTDFTTLLGSGGWDVVVIDMPSTVPSGSWESAIQTYVAGGGRVVMSYWTYQSSTILPSVFQCSSAASFSTPLPVYSWSSTHAVWTSPNTVPTLTSPGDGWADDGDRLNVTSGGTAVGGFVTSTKAGEAAIVIGNSGRTIYNGFLFDEFTADTDADGTRDVVELVANELSYVWDGACSDSDGDGHTASACGGTDCDDTRATVYPGATETCNSLDDDCDGTVDDSAIDATTWYADSDGDTWGGSTTTTACTRPSGYAPKTGDCDDGRALTYPGATEYCNGIDDDCDGSTDESGADATTWYADADSDSYGDPTKSVVSCAGPTGYVLDRNDCDDTRSTVFPGADEYCNGRDDDCDTLVDESDAVDGSTWYADSDADGFGDDGTTTTACTKPSGYVPDATDCWDDDADVNPDGTETENGVDDDCDGTVDEVTDWYDDDGDGYTEAGGDCDDGDATLAPSTVEACNGVDDDCDGTVDEETDCYDDDGDGLAEADGDCNDGDADVGLGAVEIEGNGVDDDCDGTVDGGSFDADGDGYGASTDCAPDDDGTYPGAPETADGVDNDCDGVVDEGTEAYDDDGDGFSEDEGDCNDDDDTIAPDATETANGRDDDCDGPTDEGTDVYDDDEDGFTEEAGDCDDDDPTVNPGADETANGADDDCDGDADEGTDDVDGDGYSEADGDCDDHEGWVHPGAQELCDSLDNDCDGEVDDSCAGETPAPVETGKCGCATGAGAGGAVAWLLALGLGLLRRRR